MSTLGDENLAYDCAVWNIPRLPGGDGRRHSLRGHLAQAEAKQNAPSGSHDWLNRYLTLGMAQLERVAVRGGKEQDVLSDHLPRLRRYLTPYIGSVVVPRVAQGEGTIAEITCLLNEVGGLHKRGESLIGWRGQSLKDAQALKDNIRMALSGFATTWSRTPIDGRDASALAEAVLWHAYSSGAPINVRVPRAKRLIDILQTKPWHQSVPGEVSQARREAMAVRSKGWRFGL